MADDKITVLTAATVIVDADLIPIVQDVATTPVTKKTTWSLIKSTLKTYLDTLYLALVAPGTTGNVLTSNGTSWESAAPTGGASGDGWAAISGTFSYASATTITVDSGAAAIYAIGDKLKLTQARSQAYTNDPAAGSGITLNMASTAGFNVGNKVLVSSSAGQEVARITALVANTSITVDTLALNHTTTNPLVYISDNASGVKYFYVVGVADTVLTITGGSDYTLENAAISDGYYNHLASVIGFPDWFYWLPTVTWTAGTAPTSPSAFVFMFSIKGRACVLSIYSIWTAGATVTGATIRLPVAVAIYGAAVASITAANSPNISFGYFSTNGTLKAYCSSVSATWLFASGSYMI